MSSPEENRLVALESKVKSLSNNLSTMALSLSDLTQKNAEIGMHLAALIKTIQDGRPLDANNLSISSVQNMVDKLDAYLKLALDRGLLKQVDQVADNSVVAVKQLDENGNEVIRKMLLNLNEQDSEVKTSFNGAKVTQVVDAIMQNGTKHQFVVLGIYEPTESLTEELK